MQTTTTASRAVAAWRARSNAALATIRVTVTHRPQLKATGWQRLFAHPGLEVAR